MGLKNWREIQEEPQELKMYLFLWRVRLFEVLSDICTCTDLKKKRMAGGFSEGG